MTKDEIREQFEKLVVETYSDAKYYIQPKGDKAEFLNLFQNKIEEARFIKIRSALIATRSIKAVYYEHSQLMDTKKVSEMTLTTEEIKLLKEYKGIKKDSKGKEIVSLPEGIRNLIKENGGSLSLPSG